MADDRVAIIGKWRVRFKQWTWEYEFWADGRVRWLDPFNKQNRLGQWSLAPQVINISWRQSATKETWCRPVKSTDYRGYIAADYGQGECTIERIEIDVASLLPPEFAAKPYDSSFMTEASVRFATGFAEGLVNRLPDSLGTKLTEKIFADKFGFYQGYVTGVILGLVSGLTELLKTIVIVAKVAQSVSLPNVLKSLLTEGYLLITDKTHRELRNAQIDQVKQTAEAVAGVIKDIQARPSFYVSNSYTSGVRLGQELAVYTQEIVDTNSAAELGKGFGKIVGIVLFEIVIAIVLGATTGGAGEGARAGLALGEAAQGTTKYARLLKWMNESLEELPQLRRLITAILERRGGASRAATATLEAELEAAFGEGAILQRGARGGFPLLETLPELSPEMRQAASRLLGQEFGPELRNAWNACSNQQAVRELGEVQRLLGSGSAADRNAAYQLSERTYGNWRTRFWNRVRGEDNLKKIFTDAGAVFDGQSGAPYYRIDGRKTKNLTVTLDHFIERRVDNPARAVDALNVRPSIGFENSATLEAIRRDNFLKGWR